MMNWTEKTSALNVAISLFVEHLTAKVALFCGFCGNSTLSKSVILYPWAESNCYLTFRKLLTQLWVSITCEVILIFRRTIVELLYFCWIPLPLQKKNTGVQCNTDFQNRHCKDMTFISKDKEKPGALHSEPGSEQ